MKKHKIVMSVLVVLIVILAVFLIGAWSMFGTQVKAAMSIEKLEDKLYTLEYEGNYGFDEFLEQGGAATDSEMADYIVAFLSHGFWKPDTSKMEPGEFGCSTLAAVDADGNALFGRNYDWEDCSAMVVHTKPDNGYESISTCCLDFLGFGDGWKPEGIGNQFMALAAVYIALDGMNERGLCVADLIAGDKVETHQDTDKPDLTITPAIRLMLDHAATVDEAIDLLSQYDLNSSIGAAHHLSITDASGRAVVVEYVNGQMKVTDTNVVTNHYLTQGEKYGIGSEQSHLRFDTLTKWYEKTNGIMDTNQMRDCLKSVAQSNYPGDDEGTQWSIVYNPALQTIDFYFKENYTSGYAMKLGNDK